MALVLDILNIDQVVLTATSFTQWGVMPKLEIVNSSRKTTYSEASSYYKAIAARFKQQQ